MQCCTILYCTSLLYFTKPYYTTLHRQTCLQGTEVPLRLDRQRRHGDRASSCTIPYYTICLHLTITHYALLYFTTLLDSGKKKQHHSKLCLSTAQTYAIRYYGTSLQSTEEPLRLDFYALHRCGTAPWCGSMVSSCALLFHTILYYTILYYTILYHLLYKTTLYYTVLR